MQLLIKKKFNYLKVAGINLLILLIIITIIELIFGYWFKKDNWGNQIRSFRYKNVEFTSEFNNKKYTFLYKRNSYGFRGEEHDPSKIRIAFLGGSTGNEQYTPQELSIVGRVNTFLKSKNFKYKIHNASVDGQSSIGIIHNFKIWFPKINNFNPKIYVIYLGINERYYVPKGIGYGPNPSDISSGKWRGHINDFDNLKKTSLKDQIFDHIKNDSFFMEKGKILKLRFLPPSKRTAAYDPNKFKVPARSGEIENYTFVNNDEANLIYNKEKLLIKYSGYVKSLTQRLDYINKIIKAKKALPIFINQVRFDGQKNEIMFITNVIIRKYCIDNNIDFIDLANIANLEITDFYDTMHTTPEGSNKIAKYIQNDLLKFFKKNLSD